jgi:hypothetical protein
MMPIDLLPEVVQSNLVKPALSTPGVEMTAIRPAVGQEESGIFPI